MVFNYCGNCGKNTGHERRFGIGTLIAVLFTGGLWILVMPFYPKRCTVCGKELGIEAMKKCRSCGELTIKGALVCFKCGKKQYVE